MRAQPVFIPLGAHTSNAALSAAVTLPPPAGADCLMIQAVDQNVRYRLDGGVPTATLGFQLAVGDATVIPVVGSVMVIEEVSGASIQYQWGSMSW